MSQRIRLGPRAFALLLGLMLIVAPVRAATTVIGSFAINNIVPTAAHGAGSLSFGPVAVPAGYSVIQVAFDLTQVSSLTLALSATIEVSNDSGTTWTQVGSVGLDLTKAGYVLNGPVLTRNASDPMGAGPVRMFAGQVALPHTDLATRQVRGTVTASEAATAGVTVAAF